jgi:endonuclease III
MKEGSGKYKERKLRIGKMLKIAKRLFPEARMVLRYSNNFELLVSVVLSAQCTDLVVNKVTEKLFKKYRKLDDYLNADLKEFEQDIKQTGFYRNKAKNILSAACVIKENWNGGIPKTMEEMLTIPGVARKTANVVLGNSHGIVEGIAVDTHVRRFVIRFRLSDYKDPVRIERDLMLLLPPKEWFKFTYYMIEYGRQICHARKHDCSEHPLTKVYPKAADIWPQSK